MVKIEGKYKPKAISTIKFPLGSTNKQNPKASPQKSITLTKDDYYQFSRTELWPICKFEMLVFGEHTPAPNQFGFFSLPKKGSKRYQFLSMIDDAVQSEELELHVQKREKEDPSHPLYIITNYNTDMVRADQAWLWAMSNDQKGIYKLSPEFRRMHREIMPLEFRNHIQRLPSWNTTQYIRMIFGERYQDADRWPENTEIQNMLESLEAEIKTEKLQPLDPIPYSDIKTVSFNPVDLIKFWERYDSYLETLTWVKLLFLEVKNQKGNQTASTKKPGKGFLPAPTGTGWGDVKIEITPNLGIKLWIKGKSQTYDLEKFKKEIIAGPKIREYLFKIIQSGGVFTNNNIDPDTEKPHFKSSLSRLRKKLQEVFGIQDDPLPFRGQEYQVQFKISSELKA
jgi:hypothetical protein